METGTFREDVRIIWRFLSKYEKEFYVTMFVVFLGTLMNTVVPYVYGKIVELLIAGTGLSTIAAWLVLWACFQYGYDWTMRFLYVRSGRISAKCVNDFILLLNEHSLSLKLSYHNKNKSGKLSSRYIKAGGALESLLETIVFWFGCDLLRLFCVLILIGIFVHWTVFLITVVFMAAFVSVSVRNTRPVVEHINNANLAYEDAYGIVHDTVSNIKLVKANSNEAVENEKVSAILHGRTMEHYEKYWKAIYRTFFREDMVLLMMVATSLIAVIYLQGEGIIGVAAVVTFVGYQNLVRWPLQNIGNNINHYRRWMATIRRGYSLLDEETEDYDAVGKKVLSNVKGAVEFKDVSFAYNETRQVLHGINLAVKPGEVIALVGESGVGKSTLMDLLSRYITPTSGKVLVDGVDIQRVTLKSLRSNIAIVPQDVSMFNDTVKNNLIYGRQDATEAEIAGAIKAANVEDFVNNFPNGLDEQVGERGVQLSGGQKQRIAIARAILKDPKLLILDEATSSLDSKSEALVQEAMKNLMKDRTTFVIAHRLSTITHADRIVVLEKGRIAEAGTHAELIKQKGAYYKLYKLQSLIKDKRA